MALRMEELEEGEESPKAKGKVTPLKITNIQIKKRGKSKYSLRVWLEENIPLLKGVKSGINAAKTIEIPGLGKVKIEIPSHWEIIPPDLTFDKSAANVGQTSRNAARTVDLRIGFHTIRINIDELEYLIYAIEPMN